MPLIEELPTTQTIKASHGWAYVPDTGPIAAQQPGTRDRKRAAPPSSSSSAKRAKAIQSRIDALDKENHRDGVNVPIPPSNRQRDKGRKVTSNVRRILGYQRGFAHYLADEEARNPGATHYVIPSAPGPGDRLMGPPSVANSQKGSGTESAAKDTGKRKSGARSSARTSTVNESSRSATPKKVEETGRGSKRARPSSRSKSHVPDATVKQEDEQEQVPDQTDKSAADVPMNDAPEQNPTTENNPDSEAQPEDTPQADQHTEASYPPAWDLDPLLKSTPVEVPPMPSRRVMDLLTSEPPLTYSAARAVFSAEDDVERPPSRHFCGLCGYWGRVKCKKCGEWTCGLMECWRGHEGVCIMANAY